MFCIEKWVAITQDQAEDITPGGIHIPDTHKEKHRPYRGIVEFAGTDCKHVKKGDIVRFDRTGAFTEEIEDEISGTGKSVLVFVKEEFIMCVENREFE